MKPSKNEMKEALTACSQIFLAIGLFSFFVNILQLTSPLYMLQVFDRVITTRSLETLAFLSVIAIAAISVGSLLEVFRGLLLSKVGQWLNVRMSSRMLSASVNAVHIGGGASAQAMRDFGHVRTFLTGPSLPPLLDAPWVPFFVWIMFLMHPLLGWITLGGALLMLGLAFLNEIAIRDLTIRANGVAAFAYQSADAAIRNSSAITAMGMTPNLVEHWGRSNSEADSWQTMVRNRSGLISAFAKFFRMVLQLVLMAGAAWLTIEHQVTPGTMIAASIIMGRAMAPVEQSITIWKGFLDARAAYRRIVALLMQMPERKMDTPMPPPKGRLTLEHVSYELYGMRDPLLRNIHFTLEPGESLGIIGPSGVGKSQLAELILGIRAPSSGSIRLDGVSMVDWNPEDRGRYIGYLPQSVELFAGTVRENIARLSQDNPEKVLEAATLSGAHELILRFPNGYDTPIGDHGVALSGGQRQRVGLARAVFGDPRLILLDEPNASLDTIGEVALVYTLQRLKEKQATVILITQRANILAHVDRILVLKDGAMEIFAARDEAIAAMTRSVSSANVAPKVVDDPRVAISANVAPKVVDDPRVVINRLTSTAPHERPDTPPGKVELVNQVATDHRVSIVRSK